MIPWVRTARVLALQLLHLPRDQLALQGGQVVDEQPALEVVDLVLDAGRPEAGEVLLAGGAGLVGPADADFGGAGDVGVLLGDRQAAFLVDVGLLRGPQDLRVEQHERARRQRLVLHAVHDEEADADAHLGGGEADAGGVVHRLEHVVGETAEIGGDLGDRIGAAAQPGVGMDQDVAAAHGADLGDRRRPCNGGNVGAARGSPSRVPMGTH
jgi:hypothetical protein